MNAAPVNSVHHPGDSVGYHGQLAADWEQRYRKPSFQSRLAALSTCLAGQQLERREWLDAGCGTGTLSRWLADRGCNVTGVDASADMVQTAIELSKESNRPGTQRFERVETISRLEFPPLAFDGILCSSVLEYLPDPQVCLAEFARLLRPDGVLVISVPNRNSLVRRAQTACHQFGRLLGQSRISYLDYSVNQYASDEFANLLKLHNLMPRKVVPFGSPLPRWLKPAWFRGALLMFMATKSEAGKTARS